MSSAESESKDRFRFLNNAFASLLIHFEEASRHRRIQSFSRRHLYQSLRSMSAGLNVLEVFEESSKSENETLSRL